MNYQLLIKKYNVYHLVLDEYPDTKSLKKYQNFDNSDFESFLRDKGFYVVKNSFSNYRISVESIPSILNMDYYNYLEGLDDKSRKLTVKHLGEQNSVVKNFENLGYKTIYFSNEYYIAKSPSSDEYCNMNLGELLVLNFIILQSFRISK